MTIITILALVYTYIIIWIITVDTKYFGYYKGYRLLANDKLLVSDIIEVKRSVIDRIFSLSPHIKYKSKMINVPDPDLYMDEINNRITGHSKTLQKLYTLDYNKFEFYGKPFLKELGGNINSNIS